MFDFGFYGRTFIVCDYGDHREHNGAFLNKTSFANFVDFGKLFAVYLSREQKVLE